MFFLLLGTVSYDTFASPFVTHWNIGNFVFVDL